tara:strand:- start:302 stop:688 length:387 start_codon:yes stop_codon:yes gene_type:complete
MSHIKKTVLRDLLSRLDNVKVNADDSFSFFVREVNSEKNKQIINEDLGDLKKVFKLPSPAKRDKIKKFTSSMVIHMAKQCECKIDKATKYFKVEKEIFEKRNPNGDFPDKRDSYESTSGFYEIFNLKK